MIKKTITGGQSLPFPPKPSGSIAGRTMQESVYSPLPAEKRLPEDAPNILIVLIDDAGPGLPDTFGGEVHTPTLERIYNDGIGYNRFHTTAMCSPTRASLLTGRNHHRIGNGQIAELANDWDGFSGMIPRSSALQAEVLKDYGYATAAFGKWHNTPANETTVAGPFENWPTGLGFEYFYGFLGGEASQYEPNLVRNTTSVLPPKTPEQGYHLSEDLADDAIHWLRTHKAIQPDKPFYMYWATGAIHGPHQVHKEWADKYIGKFDDGWDAYRERVFKRAKEQGWIPENAQLTPPHEKMPSWESIPEEEKPFQRRLMEVCAGFAEHADAQAGRLIDEIERLGYGDNTLIFYIWGDNGSSGEGQNGTISELLAQNGIPSTIAQHMNALDALGGLDVLGSPLTDNMYHGAWAWAGSTPYQGMKLLASHLGGTRNPMAVRWPAKIKADATPRPQFHHCNDLVPTIYEILDITPPREVNGTTQDPIDGVSMAYTFDDPQAKGQLLTQYFEIMGSRAIYHDGWMASALGPRLPWVPGIDPSILTWTPDQDTWELYDTGQRPGCTDAGKARSNERYFPDRGDQEQGIAHRRRPVCPGLSPRTAYHAARNRMGLPRRLRAHARVRGAGVGQPQQPGHNRRRDPGRCQWCALQVGRALGRTHMFCGGRYPVLRVQPVHPHAHQDPRQGQAANRQGEDRGRDKLRREEACRPIEGDPEGQRQVTCRGCSTGQCSGRIHRQ